MVLAFMLLVFRDLSSGRRWRSSPASSRDSATYACELRAALEPFGREDANYSQGWTTFYWAWWISWSPFVGMFIARVAAGRTVREFVVCVS